MGNQEHFWRLEHLSDRQLLERLQSALRTQRCALAEIVAHLGEVEQRRLHLAAAQGSLFSYCVRHLGMSEDEACRRIELARLARRFPSLFDELASGSISLSVALLLKPVLTPDNHVELVAAVRGASLRAARELLAARFPSPDAPSRIRRLPERPVSNAIPAAAADLGNAIRATVPDVAPAHSSPGAATGAAPAPTLTSWPQPRSRESGRYSLAEVGAQSVFQEPATPAEPMPAPAQPGLPRYSDPRPRIDRPRIDPLSAERYRIVFTADASLKQKSSWRATCCGTPIRTGISRRSSRGPSTCSCRSSCNAASVFAAKMGRTDLQAGRPTRQPLPPQRRAQCRSQYPRQRG